MSNSAEWTKRLDTHRYSQDERALANRFIREIKPRVDEFIDKSKEKSLLIGTYNLDKEPWRYLAVLEFRNHVSVQLKKTESGLTEIMILRKTLSRQRLG